MCWGWQHVTGWLVMIKHHLSELNARVENISPQMTVTWLKQTQSCYPQPAINQKIWLKHLDCSMRLCLCIMCLWTVAGMVLNKARVPWGKQYVTNCTKAWASSLLTSLFLMAQSVILAVYRYVWGFFVCHNFYSACLCWGRLCRRLSMVLCFVCLLCTTLFVSCNKQDMQNMCWAKLQSVSQWVPLSVHEGSHGRLISGTSCAEWPGILANAAQKHISEIMLTVLL